MKRENLCLRLYGVTENQYRKPSNNLIVIPKESLFGLLIYPDQLKTLIPQFKNYSFTKLAVVDLNEISPESKGYNNRLVKNYYLVKKLNTK